MRFQSNSSFSPLAPTSTSDPYGVAVTPYTTTGLNVGTNASAPIIPAPPAGSVNHIRWWMVEAGNFGPIPSAGSFVRIMTTGTNISMIGYVVPTPAIPFCQFSDVDIYITQGLSGSNGLNVASTANFTIVWRVEPIF